MIWEEFQTRAEQNVERTAFVSPARTMSYAEVLGAVPELAAALPGPGSPRPRRVIIRQTAPLKVILSVLACWRSGCVPVILREHTPAAQAEEMIRWLRPAAVLHDDSLPGSVAASPAGRSREATFSPRDEALVICTSGTTTSPKLVALPAESVCLNASAISSSLELVPGDRVAVNTPLGYMYGLMGGCMASLWAGATCFLFDPREPLTRLQAEVKKHGISVVQGPPSLFRLFFAYADGAQFDWVRLVTTGGEAFSERLLADLEHTFPRARQLVLYGMTEAGPRISHETLANGGGRDACVGVPYPHFEWRMEPADGMAAAHGSGRLSLRGPSMFLGYIAPDGSYAGLDADGFFRSNDVVSIDAVGRLHFRGRIDRVFKSGGKLVSPDEIERVLRLHASVADAVVYPAPHPLLGLVPEADVIAAAGAACDPEELTEFVRGHAEPHAVPRSIKPAAGGLSDSGKLARGRVTS